MSGSDHLATNWGRHFDSVPRWRQLAGKLVDPKDNDGVRVLICRQQERPSWVDAEIAGRFALRGFMFDES